MFGVIVRSKKEKERYRTDANYRARAKQAIKIIGVRNRERAKNYLFAKRLNSVCLFCGNNDYRCIDFHHVNKKEKTATFHELVTNRVSVKVMKKEMDKCVPLCRNCHSILHYNERKAKCF